MDAIEELLKEATQIGFLNNRNYDKNKHLVTTMINDYVNNRYNHEQLKQEFEDDDNIKNLTFEDLTYEKLKKNLGTINNNDNITYAMIIRGKKTDGGKKRKSKKSNKKKRKTNKKKKTYKKKKKKQQKIR